jgi:hypothetical protein
MHALLHAWTLILMADTVVQCASLFPEPFQRGGRVHGCTLDCCIWHQISAQARRRACTKVEKRWVHGVDIEATGRAESRSDTPRQPQCVLKMEDSTQLQGVILHISSAFNCGELARPAPKATHKAARFPPRYCLAPFSSASRRSYMYEQHPYPGLSPGCHDADNNDGIIYF